MTAINKTTDVRALQSRSQLLKALLTLMQETEYKNINVKVLTERAGVARQTFYRNFKSIDDILIQEMDRRHYEYNNLVETDICAGNILRASEKMFILLEKSFDLQVAMQKANINHKIIHRYEKYAMNVMQIATKGRKLTDKSLFAAQFLAGGSYMVFNKWVESNMEAPIAEVAELMKDYLELLTKQ